MLRIDQEVWPSPFVHRLHHWLVLGTLDLYIVNVQWILTSDRFLTIFTFLNMIRDAKSFGQSVINKKNNFNLEDTSPLCRATDTPVLDLWWCLLWVSKPEWAALFALGGGIHVTHPWDLCWPLGGQHGSWTDLFHIPATRHWWGSKVRSIVPRGKTLPTELCPLGYK